ncbi:MAG: DUF1275 domain-containing protein [Treponema sp.]|nr:DUF1275 domain-containing protein [Treponema sp.]
MGTDSGTKELRRLAFLTWASIFIMGYLNGFAIRTAFLGSAVTPQTGNVLQMGLNTAAGNWPALLVNFALFFGFIIGVIFALFTQNSIKHKTGQFIFSWTIFALPIALFPFYMQFLNRNIAFLILGFVSGVGLGFFRKIYHLDINNAMATGNVRFLGIWFAEAFMKKARTDKKEVFTFVIFLVCILLFALGAFFYGVFSKLDNDGSGSFSFVNTALIIFCAIPYLAAPKNTAS